METKVAKWKQKNGIFGAFNKNVCIPVSFIMETMFSIKFAKWKHFQNIVIK